MKKPDSSSDRFFIPLGKLLCLFLLTTAAPASADTEQVPLEWNSPPSREKCPDSPSYLWVEHRLGKECIRYFSQGDTQRAPVVIIQFYGDRDRIMRLPPEVIAGNTRKAQEAYAAAQARKSGLPVIVVARPGTYGSTGDHGKRRQRREFLSLDAALDRLRVRYRIERLVLLGHSGGATAAAALLTLGREDIRCAVLTSGAYALLRRASYLRTRDQRPLKPGFDTTGYALPYDPLDHIDGIVEDPLRSIYVLGNRRDQNTPFKFQRLFAEALGRAGHEVILGHYPARGPNYHRLGDDIGIRIAAACAL